MVKNLIIVGAGGMGREVLQWIKDINQAGHTWDILGFIDDNAHALDNIECDYGIVGSISEWDVKKDEYFAVAIADPKTKRAVVEKLKARGAKFAAIIHPRARIGEFNTIGEGAVIYPDASLSVNIRIGDFITLLPSTIGHDAVIGDYCSVMGKCSINGNVHIGDNVYLGCGCIVAPRRNIGDNVYAAMGSVIMTNIRKGIKVMGNPARKYNL